MVVNDVVFGAAHHVSDGSFTVRDGFELAGSVIGGLAGSIVGGMAGGVPAITGGIGGSVGGGALGGALYDVEVLGGDRTHTVATQVHGEGRDQLKQQFGVIGSKWENGERVDIIHVTEVGPGGPKQWIYTVPNGQAEIDRLNAEASAVASVNHCFISDTSIQMWPLDQSIELRADGTYSEQLVLSKVWDKPIVEVEVGDLVVSYDAKGQIKPGQVTRTMQNHAAHVLDFWGTGITPGHACFCADGKFRGNHVPIMDILRTDAAMMRADSTMFRAATNCEVGSIGDRLIHAAASVQAPNGSWTEPKPGKVRFGTQIVLSDGRHISFMEIAESNGWQISNDGYMVVMAKGDDGTLQAQKFHFPYTYGENLPKPEDYILARSAVTLEEIYAAGEWEQIGTRMPAPTGMVGLNTNHSNALLQPSKPQPNMPPAFESHPDAPRVGVDHPKNRKQGKAVEATQRRDSIIWPRAVS
ncbi:MAG: hypothetical protein ABJQ34_06780 [Paracoccaceae bacterium]